MSTAYDVDVIQMSDFRLPGGTTSSIAEEVRAQSEAGISTAMIHIAGSVTNYPNGWSSHIRKVVGLPGVRLCTPHTPLRAKVLVVRHPTVLFSTRTSLANIHADHIVVVANHAAIDAAGTQHYDVAATDAKVREVFGKAPIWSPIGPVVRGTILQQTREIPLREVDWFNVFNFPGQIQERTGFVEDKPVIGRHSRPQPGKWPNTGQDILAAYPASVDYQVRVLGGAQIAQKLLGYVPQNWEVIPFGGEDPVEFLQRIDFWVYMHHPDLKEAFGRAAMESLAAGCVAVMPPYMEELFGDAALYAEPQQVRALIDEYAADREKFLAQSRRAQDFARSFSPQMHVERLAELGAVPSADDFLARPAQQVLAAERPEDQGPVLFLMDGEQPEQDLETFSRAYAAVPQAQWATVGEQVHPDFTPEDSLFISSACRMNMAEDVWNAYFTKRLETLTSRQRPQRVVYSGSLPPQSLLQWLKAEPAQKTWVQQPLRSADLGEKAIQAALSFHTVLAPDVSDDELQAVLPGGSE